MAKRFASTEIWDEDWFLELPIEYKLFWFYLLSACDHAGFFKVNIKTFSVLNNVEISSETAFELFNKGKKRLRKVNGSMWFIEEFFTFQNGHILNLNNNSHKSMKGLFDKHGVELGSVRGLKEVKDTPKRGLKEE